MLSLSVDKAWKGLVTHFIDSIKVRNWKGRKSMLKSQILILTSKEVDDKTF